MAFFFLAKKMNERRIDTVFGDASSSTSSLHHNSFPSTHRRFQTTGTTGTGGTRRRIALLLIIAAAATLFSNQLQEAVVLVAATNTSNPMAAAAKFANGNNSDNGIGGGSVIIVMDAAADSVDGGGSGTNSNGIESLGNGSSSTATALTDTEAAMDTDSAAIPADCQYDEPPLTAVRFWIVTIFGTSIALCSIMENAFFFYLFITRKHHRTSFNCYMMFIALFDLLISSSYIFLMSMNVLMDFLQSLMLFRIWHYYMVPMITISHCAITAGSFLILAATIERYFLTSNSRYIRSIQRNRKWVILFAILMAILSKGSICMEFKISYREECANTMSEIDIGFADFVFDTDYHLYFRFYYRNFVTIFLPFFALLFLNFKIIHMLAKFEKENYQFQLLNSATATAKQIKRKKVTRAATITTILVVCTYLISNIISVALTTWEHIDKTSLMSDYLQIYLISIDFTSLLTVTACAFRPLIYLICQPALRKEVFALMKGTFHMDDGSGTDPGLRRVSAFEPMYNSVEVSTPMYNPAFVIGADTHRLSIPQIRRDSAAGAKVKILTNNNNNNNNNNDGEQQQSRSQIIHSSGTSVNGAAATSSTTRMAFLPHLEQFKLVEDGMNNNNNNNNSNDAKFDMAIEQRKTLHKVDSDAGGKLGQTVRSILYTGNETLL